eukprot:3310549-Rhodomonas_salina.1
MEGGDVHIQAFPPSNLGNEPVSHIALDERVSIHQPPVPQCCVKAHRLCHGQVGSQVVHRCPGPLFHLDDGPAAELEGRLDRLERLLGALVPTPPPHCATDLDFDEKHRLHQARLRAHLCAEHDPARGRDDLSGPAVYLVRVQRGVQHGETNPSHLLLAQHPLLRYPREARQHCVADLVEIMRVRLSLRLVHQQVRPCQHHFRRQPSTFTPFENAQEQEQERAAHPTCAVWPERPDPPRHLRVPPVVVREPARADVDVSRLWRFGDCDMHGSGSRAVTVSLKVTAGSEICSPTARSSYSRSSDVPSQFRASRRAGVG